MEHKRDSITGELRTSPRGLVKGLGEMERGGAKIIHTAALLRSAILL